MPAPEHITPSDHALDPRLRALLIQVREAAEVADHERRCILERTDLAPDQVDAVNVAETPVIPWERVEPVDAIIIGGSGMHSAAEDYDFTEPLGELIRRIIAERRPLFGSCWGHQFIARVMGGTVIHDAANAEVGTIDVELTDAGADDEIFGACPRRFPVLMGHHDRVSALPPGAVELAASDRCRNQAFRLDGVPVYCTQFHAEMTPEHLVERLQVYQHYVPDPAAFEEMRRGLVPTPHADAILRRFLAACVDRRR